MPDFGPPIAPYGSWASPIDSAFVAGGRIPLAEPRFDGEDAYWIEGRPLEGGRYVVVRLDSAGKRTEITPPAFSVRTRVHEYGGGAYCVRNGVVVFANYADQRLYRQDSGDEPRPITPEPEVPGGPRYADMCFSADGGRMYCVREEHRAAGEVVNELVVLPADGSSEPGSVTGGRDFYAFPRLSPDGRRLAYSVWDHPNMPWDGCELWVANVVEDGTLEGAKKVAGGPAESIFQPEWSPDGVLHFVSDRTGWWNLYRLAADGNAAPLYPIEAEMGTAQWVFGMSTYAFLAGGVVAAWYFLDGGDHLCLIGPDGHVEMLDTSFTSFGYQMASRGNELLFLAASPDVPNAVVRARVAGAEARFEVLRKSIDAPIDQRYVSVPLPLTFPTTGGREAHAIFYPPRNAAFAGPPDERPPLLVLSHGGPTAMAKGSFDAGIQFWTGRGFAVVDVNYGGSTGYGREYRQRLNGQWGIVDVDDCVNAARYLAALGKVDGSRLAIRGGSAGGYTTLCALVFKDVFAAGASYYGVADVEALELDTHKFEAQYSHSLIGPYPEDRQTYFDRSPLHFTDRLSCPVILFQGLEDRVVPPAQAESMAAALRAKGIPFAYLAFEGEQHGFRKAETNKRALEAELSFYSRVFGFTPAGEIEPVSIENEQVLGSAAPRMP